MKTVERLGADMSVCLSIFARNQSCRVRRRAIVLYLGIFVGFDVGLPAASYTAAQAADAILSQPWGQVPSSKTPAGQATTRFDWTGLYFGGHVGYSRGSSQVALGDPDPTSFRNSFGSLGAGVQAGYNRVLPSRLLLGVEADLSVLNYLSGDDLAWSRTTPDTDLAEKIELMGTLRGRVGYAFDHWMVYATGGLAWALGRFLQTPGVVDDTDRVLHLHTGWSVGAGTEVAIAPSWALRLEYLYRNFGHADVVFPSGTTADSAYDVHTVRVGLNYKIGPPGENAWAGNFGGVSQTQFDNWEIHGQTTYIQQGYPAFHSPYVGTNSFTPWAQTRQTWTTSAFLGLRLWEGGELYYNPELLQGFGLHDTTGAAGFPNGEAQKSNFPYPRYNTSRLFLRQTLGFGGEHETIESSYGQMAEKRDISRFSVQVGKFAVHDVFDNNAYAMDSRADFMNWSIWASGAFDYPADRVGLTYGAVVELNQKHWALRVGYFLTANEPNANEFDMNLFARGAYVTELETRYTLFSRPGKFRVAVWADTSFSGSYREAIDLTLINPGLDPNDAIRQTRQGRTKYGYYLNFEQAITDDVGIFGRWSWNDGKTEIAVFTDIDASLSLGTSIRGTSWGRPDDRIGLAGAVNALSRDHRDFLAIGGLGILIGDGQINYRPEKILETFYAYNINKWSTLTFDYQFIADIAHNADRGPVSVFSARLHAEF
jgi:high affinity Mn2+ porin